MGQWYQRRVLFFFFFFFFFDLPTYPRRLREPKKKHAGQKARLHAGSDPPSLAGMISTPQQTARAPARGSWKIAKWPSPEIEDLANKSKWVYVQAGSHTLGLRGGRA